MDSPGWFDSGYVVPGTDADIGGKKIFTNYNNTRMYIEGQNSAIEEDFRDHWYYTGITREFTEVSMGEKWVENTKSYTIYSNYNSTKTLVKGSIWDSEIHRIYDNPYIEIKGYCTRIYTSSIKTVYYFNKYVQIDANTTHYHYSDSDNNDFMHVYNTFKSIIGPLIAF